MYATIYGVAGETSTYSSPWHHRLVGLFVWEDGAVDAGDIYKQNRLWCRTQYFFFFCLGQSVVLLVEVYTHKKHSVALFSLVQHSGILFYRGCQLQTTKLYLWMALTFTASRRRSSALYESPIIINNNNPMRALVGAFDAAVHKSTHTHSDRHRRRHPKWPLVFNVHFSYPQPSNWTLLCNTVKRWRA